MLRIAIVLLVVLLAGCATGTRLHANHVPEGALRVAQAVKVVGGAVAFEAGEQPLRDVLSQAGLSDAEIRQGMVVLARVLCCGVNEQVNSIMFFSPAGIAVGAGDFVELKSGRAGDPKAINVATRVWQKEAGPSVCRWLPDDPRLAARVIYCDGMKEQGWVQQPGRWNFWMRQP